MTTKARVALPLWLIISGLFAESVLADSGKILYTDKACHICHSVSGKAKIKGMPRLYGQKKQYLVNQINDILSGKRDNHYSQLMRMNYSLKKPAKGSLERYLTKKEIAQLADYLNQLK